MEEYYRLRDVYESHIREHTLGPGFAKEVILCSEDCSDEVLDKNPLNIYSTGILYPQQADPNNDDAEESENAIDYEDEEIDVAQADDSENDEDEDDDRRNHDHNHNNVPYDQPYWLSDHFGLITCVPENTNEINVKVKYAKYQRVEGKKRTKVKINVGALFDHLDELLKKYDDDDKVIQELRDKNINGTFSNLIGRDEVAKTIWLEWEDNRPMIASSCFPHAEGDLHQLNNYLRMLFGDFYKRKEYACSRTIDVSSPCKGDQNLEEFKDAEDVKDDILVYRTCICKNGKKYIKILVRNAHRYSGNQGRWALTLFQPQITVTPVNSTLISYTEPIQMDFDSENNTVEFVYRNVVNYGKGVLCAVEWDDEKSIRTSFMPKSDVKKFSSQLDKLKDAEYCEQIRISADAINECCKLYNLSHWQADNEVYINRLTTFVNGYENWCNLQNGQNDGSDEANGIIERQQELLERLRDNIKYLKDNAEALTCFKWANTAMLIQMTIARNATFKKNRDGVGEIPNELSWFRENHNDCRYYPFQLAFLLMNVKSTFIDNDKYRNDVVDLIWFPTGGGKTEAYLALAALTIIARRRSSEDDAVTKGVSVLMRYTLRLLTSQQFERASYLICALDFLRQQDDNGQIRLGGTKISIGLWIGNSGNDNLKKGKKWGRFDSMQDAQERLHTNNPYPVTYCPWCGQKLVTSDIQRYGYINGEVGCLNENCSFNGHIPVYFVSEDVESKMPTMLFATVDKLAGLYRDNAADMFGFRDPERRSLDLIIQDELHLISGPLGSMVGFFESVVEKIATKDGRKPKIIASTATTRNTQRLIANLYNNREVRVFPAQGLTYDDNYFSHVESTSLRRHIGICMQRKPVDSEVRLVAQMLIARLKVLREGLKELGVVLSDRNAVYNALLEDGKLKKLFDSFWSQVLYYNSLKDLGRMHSRIGQEVEYALRYFLRYVQIPESLRFAVTGVYNRVKEFTSREDSSRIKDLLTQAESAATIDTENNMVGGNTIDLVLASNMISVGIDINRWNVMLMSGQPRSTSEYIQSSSRVARSNPGLVINEYSPMRIREISMFENFTSFHASYYKYVEPLSATPVTMQTLQHDVFHNIVLCYKKYFANDNTMSDEAKKGVLLDDLGNRYNIPGDLEEIAKNLIDDKWDDVEDLEKAKSLRDIDKDCYTSIYKVNYPNR